MRPRGAAGPSYHCPGGANLAARGDQSGRCGADWSPRADCGSRAGADRCSGRGETDQRTGGPARVDVGQYVARRALQPTLDLLRITNSHIALDIDGIRASEYPGAV
jgi:hypothetical protein